MSKSRKKERSRRRRAWEEALWTCYERVLQNVQPAAEHQVPGEALVAEAGGRFPPRFQRENNYRAPDLGASEQYMGYRMIGFGRSEDERDWIADVVRGATGDTPAEWQTPSGKPRRSEAAGRRRNAQRATRRTA